MSKPLTIEEKQGVLMGTLLEMQFKTAGWAAFGIEAEVVKPLIKKGWIHKATYKYTGGATLTQAGRDMLKAKIEQRAEAKIIQPNHF